MKTAITLLVVGVALCLARPASAGGSQSAALALNSAALAQQSDLSSRHKPWRRGHVVSYARACPGYTYAPISHKVFNDRRWPYVNWRGACDSLYAPGPLVTFVRYPSY